MKNCILVVDDEAEAIELLRFNLKNAGYTVVTAESGEQALAKARSHIPDLIILDVMLPEIDGFEVCRTLRRDANISHIPILMLTAKADEISRILGLEFGADDYITKPFSPRELLLRVKNLLHRRQAEVENTEVLQIGPLTIDIPKHRVLVKGREIELTATEFKLLATLAQRRGRVQSREQLLRDVWEYDTTVETRTVDTHVRRLREKLGVAAKYIGTLRSIGYRFIED